MKARIFAALLCALGFVATGRSAATAEKSIWHPLTWNGERAFVADSGQWRAIVSADRARLVYFGAAGREHNLLFAPAERNGPHGWGGHRLWLGPQSLWNWPPPAAWESSPAKAVAEQGGRLIVTLPEAGDGYPSLVHEYYWGPDGLHCNARISGGTRAVQIIHIVQVPDRVTVRSIQAPPTAYAPRGYVQVHLGRTPSPQPNFAAPGQVTPASDGLQLHFTGVMEKLGFPPQPLHGVVDGQGLRVERGTITGAVGATPDEGFSTQVYLGRPDGPLIELEQLSPYFRPGQPASFEIVIVPE